MMGQQSGTLQWPIGYTTTGTGPYQTDASKCWSCMSRNQNRESVVQVETGSTNLHINQLELLAIKFAIFTFAKMWKMSAIHIHVDNMTVLSYLLKMVGTNNPKLMQISNQIWEFLHRKGITITADLLQGNLNCKADWESRH